MIEKARTLVDLPQVDPEVSERLAAAKLLGARSTCFACKNIQGGQKKVATHKKWVTWFIMAEENVNKS